MIILLLAIILCSFSFYFIVLRNPNNSSLELESFAFAHIYYIYEKKVICLLFAAFLILILFYSHEIMQKSGIFIVFSRASFIYMCILDPTIYLFFSFFSITNYLCYLNMFFYSLSMIFITYLFSILMNYLLNPVRIFIKSLLRRIQLLK